jgi:nucleoside-diphosphate-sugar epimerase
MPKLIFGCGYLGLRVARRWRERDENVFAVTRSAERAAALAAEGLRPLVADVTRPETLANLPAAETVLYSVGFDRAAGHAMREVYVGGLRAALDRLHQAATPEFQRLIYISSTGVYGQCSGEWVDEQSTCEPTREGGRVCLEAEQVLMAHALGQRAMILRLAGIYGPERIPQRSALASGEPIAAPAEGYLNLIHVDDAAAAVLAAEARGNPPALYVLSDGQPVTRRDFYAELARLTGVAAPGFKSPAAGSPKAQRAETSKRINSARVVRDLSLRLEYPSYREGLAAILG